MLRKCRKFFFWKLQDWICLKPPPHQKEQNGYPGIFGIFCSKNYSNLFNKNKARVFSSGLFLGSIPRVYSSGLFHGSIPRVYSSGLFLGSIPRVYSSGLFHGSIPRVHSSGLFLGFIPRVYSTGLFLGPIPRVYFKICFFAQSPIRVIARPSQPIFWNFRNDCTGYFSILFCYIDGSLFSFILFAFLPNFLTLL